MSLTADFDFVAEISKATLLAQVKAKGTIGGVSLNPPFELTVPITGQATGSAHVIVDDLDLTLANDEVTLILKFSNSTAILTSPTAMTLTSLSGTVEMTAPLALAAAGANKKSVVLDLSRATLTLAFNPGNAILPVIAPIAATAIQAYIRTQTSPVLLAFDVVTGKDGHLSPSPVFEELQVHTIGATAVGLFGNFLLAHHGAGNHAQKTSAAITGGHTVAISLSPSAFHSLIFCPAVASSLAGGNVDALPTTCGTGSPINVGGATLESLTDSFAAGHVAVNGSVSKSGTCYEASGTFHAALHLSIKSGKITPTVTVDDPDVDVDIPWYCWLVAGIVLGPLGILITGIIEAIASSVADDIAKGAISSALGSGLPSSGIPGLAGATFDAVAISTEGLCLNGNVTVSTPTAATPSLALNGSVVVGSSTVIGSGTFQDTSICRLGDFPCTEYSQQETGTYTVSAKLLGTPLTLQWMLEGGSSKVTLVGVSGTAVLQNIDVRFPTPYPVGTGHVQDVDVGWTVAGSTIKLTNLRGRRHLRLPGRRPRDRPGRHGHGGLDGRPVRRRQVRPGRRLHLQALGLPRRAVQEASQRVAPVEGVDPQLGAGRLPRPRGDHRAGHRRDRPDRDRGGAGPGRHACRRDLHRPRRFADAGPSRYEGGGQDRPRE